jgi:hypothetical protein
MRGGVKPRQAAPLLALRRMELNGASPDSAALRRGSPGRASQGSYKAAGESQRRSHTLSGCRSRCEETRLPATADPWGRLPSEPGREDRTQPVPVVRAGRWRLGDREETPVARPATPPPSMPGVDVGGILCSLARLLYASSRPRCWPASTAREASRAQPAAAEGRLEHVRKVGEVSRTFGRPNARIRRRAPLCRRGSALLPPLRSRTWQHADGDRSAGR